MSQSAKSSPFWKLLSSHFSTRPCGRLGEHLALVPRAHYSLPSSIHGIFCLDFLRGAWAGLGLEAEQAAAEPHMPNQQFVEGSRPPIWMNEGRFSAAPGSRGMLVRYNGERRTVRLSYRDCHSGSARMALNSASARPAICCAYIGKLLKPPPKSTAFCWGGPRIGNSGSRCLGKWERERLMDCL